MRCVDCRWFNRENEFCMKDGGSIFGATIDDECDYADNMTVFDRLTASPEVMAPHFVYHVTSFLDGLDKPKKIWYSTLLPGRFFYSETDAKRATVARLKEVK